MSIDSYISELETLIASCSIMSSYTLTIDRKADDIAHLSGIIEFRNGTALDFKEFIESKGQTVEKYMYGYNYRQEGAVFFRYDNSPDPRAKKLNSFPHHKHLPAGDIVESRQVNLAGVLEEIESRYGLKEE